MNEKELETLKVSFRRLTKGGKRNLKFPILRILLDKKDVSSESELYELGDKELRQAQRLIDFLQKEFNQIANLSEDEGKLHRYFLLHATRQCVRALYLLRKTGEMQRVASSLNMNANDVHYMFKKMIARGCHLPECKPFSFYERFVHNMDSNLRGQVWSLYDAKDFDHFAQRLRTHMLDWNSGACETLAAFYERSKLLERLNEK